VAQFSRPKMAHFEKTIDIQSNATLITDNFLDFFEKNNFHLGSSLDGPEDIHNLTRIYPDGRGSFKDAWAGIQKIKQRNKALEKRVSGSERPQHLGGGAIVILTRKNINKIEEIYNFFKFNKMPIKINPLIRAGKAKELYEDLSIGAKEYGKCLLKLFDKWFYEKEEGIDIDPLSDILGNLMTGKPVGCNFGSSCREGFISIGPDGDIYPCGRFDGLKKYWLGNINKDKLSDVLKSKKHEVMLNRNFKTVKGCFSCNYSNICNAGCMHSAFLRRGNLNDRDYYCPSYKILFEHLEKAITLEIQKAKVGNKYK